MAAYEIHCITYPMASGRFAIALAIVRAQVGGGVAAKGARRKPDFWLVESTADATFECARLVDELRNEMSTLGHEVVCVKGLQNKSRYRTCRTQ
jgi:hypothetical protein